MERQRQLKIGAINITLPPPHTPERYITLFQEARKLERKVKLRGDLIGLLGSVQVTKDEDGSPVIHGEFFKYVDLDATRDWFNIRRGKPAAREELESINIPDELKPHFQFLPFVFFARRHRLVLVTKDKRDTLSPKQAATILQHTFEAPELLQSHGKADIVVEPSLELLDTIFKAQRLRSLIIEITPPNPDDFEEFEKEIFENMNEQRAGSYRIEMREADGLGLSPDARTKLLAKVAQSNGSVIGVSGQRGKTKTVSTKSHPLEEHALFLPNLQPRSEALLIAGAALLKRILN